MLVKVIQCCDSFPITALEMKVLHFARWGNIHTARTVQAWCENNFKSFWSKELWPSSFPGLNPMDFGGVVYLGTESLHCIVSKALKQKLTESWGQLKVKPCVPPVSKLSLISVACMRLY